MEATVPLLNSRFHSLRLYRADPKTGYQLLPFNFLNLDEKRKKYILTNLAGEQIVCKAEELREFVDGKTEKHSQLYESLKSKHFLFDEESDVAIDLLAAKFKRRQDSLTRGTSLFIFVTTLRCDHTCKYCQVSRQTENKIRYDMTKEHAILGIAFMFQTKSRFIKVEFQGGESLLNFDLIKFVVEKTNETNLSAKKRVSFVITTNLAMLSADHLEYCAEHNIEFSTSLDGPADLHDANRPRPGKDSHARTIRGIHRIRDEVSPCAVSALMTTTAKSLERPKDIVDEYRKHGYNAIFLRSISPYGFATKTAKKTGYLGKEWLEFYREALDYIFLLNENGHDFREIYTTLLLKKMFSAKPTFYVDLQSPAGIGLSAIVFNYDGCVYASDEGRMLAEMNDKTFLLGHLDTDSFTTVMQSEKLWQPLEASLGESSPMCTDCALLPYCGSEPVYHHATQNDFCGFKPTSGFCEKNMGIMRHLITILQQDSTKARILKSWVFSEAAHA